MPHDDDTARQGRHAALGIAAGGLLAIFAPAVPRALGIAPRYEILIYLIALACFVWSLAITWRLWHKTRDR
ncbi:MAG: DUF5337 family protein [Paracoccaceae bacterium]